MSRLGQIKIYSNCRIIPYDPISHRYYPTEDGIKLKFMDDQVKVRHYARANRLDRINNQRYNPINGQERLKMDDLVPP